MNKNVLRAQRAQSELLSAQFYLTVRGGGVKLKTHVQYIYQREHETCALGRSNTHTHTQFVFHSSLSDVAVASRSSQTSRGATEKPACPFKSV